MKLSKKKKLIVSLCLPCLFSTADADNLNCPCKVVKISDGDTIHVLDQNKQRHKIRLAAIDAPETSQVHGRKSAQNLVKLIAGQEVEVEYRKKDRYGRIVGKVMLSGQDINLAQVIEGYAWHYKYYQREQPRMDQLLYSSAETEARARHIGLWSLPGAIPPWEYRKQHR